MLSASRIATDVWVNAAGLMMMPSAPLMPPWIQSMICASLFDWWNEIVEPALLGARAAHLLDLLERGRAVDVRLARAEQVEVGAVQDQDRFAHAFLRLRNSLVALTSSARRAPGSRSGRWPASGTSTPNRMSGGSASISAASGELAFARQQAARARLDDQLVGRRRLRGRVAQLDRAEQRGIEAGELLRRAARAEHVQRVDQDVGVRMIGARHHVDRMRERLHRPERHEFEIDRDAVGQRELRHFGKLVGDSGEIRAVAADGEARGADRRAGLEHRPVVGDARSRPTAAPSRPRAPSRRSPPAARRISACSAGVVSGYTTPPGEAGAVRSPIDAKPARAASSTSSSGGTSSSLRCASDSGTCRTCARSGQTSW